MDLQKVIVEVIILQSREQEQWYRKHRALKIIAHKSIKGNNTTQFQHLGYMKFWDYMKPSLDW